MIVPKFKEDLLKFIELPDVEGIGHTNGDEDDMFVFFKRTIPEKTKREVIFSLFKIPAETIELLKDFSKEELQRMEKLVRVNTLRKEVEKIEAELSL